MQVRLSGVLTEGTRGRGVAGDIAGRGFMRGGMEDLGLSWILGSMIEIAITGGNSVGYSPCREPQRDWRRIGAD